MPLSCCFDTVATSRHHCFCACPYAKRVHIKQDLKRFQIIFVWQTKLLVFLFWKAMKSGIFFFKRISPRSSWYFNIGLFGCIFFSSSKLFAKLCDMFSFIRVEAIRWGHFIVNLSVNGRWTNVMETKKKERKGAGAIKLGFSHNFEGFLSIFIARGLLQANHLC